MIEFKFNHELETIPVAMGLSKEIDDLCRERVLFTTFTNYFIKEDFY